MTEKEGPRVVTELPAGAKVLPDDVVEQIHAETWGRDGALLEKIIDRASDDPGWKQKLLSDPKAALEEAGLSSDIDALNRAISEPAEVVGQLLVQGGSQYATRWYQQFCWYSALGIGPWYHMQ